MTEKMQTRLPILLAVTLAAGMFIGQQLPHGGDNFSFSPGPARSLSPAAGTLDEVLRYIQAKYVDTVDIESVKAGALNHLLEKLDPHSVYISPDEMEAVQEDMSGNFEGIGIEFLIVEDTIQVVAPLSGGPSEAAGMLAGDKIVRIGDSTVAGVKIDNGRIYKMLRGAAGSQVKIAVLRGAEKTVREFNITRDLIPVHSVDVAYMLDEATGYFKINRFSAQTHQEFMSALRPLVEEKGMRNLLLDLRGNPGGYLNEATDLLSQIFPEGKLLVYTKGRAESRRDYKSSGRARFKIENVAVLIDEGSASASEIVAGAVQDHDRGWVIGRRSYGKGLVQEQYPLEDGGALRLTVARYFTPSGRCIQRDYKNGEDYDAEEERRLHSGELSDGKKMKVADSTAFYTGMGRVVFGGGGIIPDVFIPLDTAFANHYFFEVRRLVPEFAARWTENRGKNFFTGSLAEFVRGYAVSDEMLEELLAYTEKSGVKRNAAQLARCTPELKLQLKARLAKLLFKDEGLYTVLNDDDPAVEKARQVLKSGEPVAKRN